MNSKPIDSKRAGASNENFILRLRREHGHLSQSQLCQMTGLGSSTASSIVSRLREKGLVLESEGKSLKRGPKPVILQINPRGRFILGLEINPDHVNLGLFDFNTELIETCRIDLLGDHRVERVVELLATHVLGLLERHAVDQAHVLGVGVTLSGTVSSDGRVVLASPLGWKNVPLKEDLEARLECPVSLFGTRVRLLAEMALEPDSSLRNVLYVNVADGVGCSAVIDGQLLQGATSRGGEIGHIIVDPQGPLCGCGHTGCLEALVSGPALAERIHMQARAKPQSWLGQKIKADDKHKTIICKWQLALERRDELALEMLAYFSDHLGRALALAINLYDPELVILAGYVCMACDPFLMPALEPYIDANVYNSDSRVISMRPAQASEHALMVGGAMAVWQHALSQD
jgi:N-acetylglucosamine repressor